MKKTILFLLSLLVLGAVMIGCGTQATNDAETSKEAINATNTTNATNAEMKIAYGVQAINNSFHQAQANWAKKYAEEKYENTILTVEKRIYEEYMKKTRKIVSM